MKTKLPCPPHPFYWYTAALMMLAGLLNALSLEPAFGAEEDKARWNKKYDTEKYIAGRDPIPFLQNHTDLLPKGKALDLAIGEGRNGVYLATQGFQVTGVDISEVGLKKAQALAAEKGVTLATIVADLEQYDIPPNTFDVIICAYYLQRDLFRRRLSPQLLEQPALGADEAIDRFHHMNWNANRACLVGDGAADSLPNPPGGIG